MKINKRGQGGLSTDTIIIAIIAIIVLLLVVTFFTGGVSTVFGKIRDVFTGGTAGYDVDLAKSNCQDYCQRAITLNQEPKDSTYCTQTFKNVNKNKDGKLSEDEKISEGLHCKDIPG